MAKVLSKLSNSVFYPAKIVASYTDARMRRPYRTTTVIFVGILTLIWLSYILSLFVTPSSGVVFVAITILSAVVYGNAAAFTLFWQRRIRGDFANLQLVPRFEFINIEKLGSQAVAVVLVLNIVFVFIEYFKITTLSGFLAAVPYTLFIAGRLVFRLNIAQDQVIRTAKEGILNLTQIPSQHQATALVLIHDKVMARLHSFAPLMTFDINGILGALYYAAFLGTDPQKAEAQAFLDSIENDFKTSKSGLTMLNLIRTCKLSSSVLPSTGQPTFVWERRADWWRRLDRIGTIILVITSIISTIAVLHII